MNEPSTFADSPGEVMAVDDTEANLRVLESILERSGYRVRLAKSGAMALASVKVKAPDLILLDLRMPKMDGLEVCRRLKADAATAAVPVIFVTVADEIDSRVAGFSAGAVDYVSKPFNEPELLARVSTHLGLARLRRDLEARNQELVATQRRLLEEIDVRRRAEHAQLGLREELRAVELQKRESLGLLAGGVAHDFNNLLMGVFGNVDLARFHVPDASPVRTYLDAIAETGRQLAALTSRMLAYSGRSRFLVEPVDLNKVVLDTGHLLQSGQRQKPRLSYQLQPDLPTCQADSGQISQLVVSLLTNAIEALNNPAEEIRVGTGVQLLCQRDGGQFALAEALPVEPSPYVFVEVADPGCGMDEDTQRRMFDPFFSTKFLGRGLGLAAVHGIVRGHHGAIRVDTRISRGTTIRVLIPVRPTTPPTSVEQAP